MISKKWSEYKEQIKNLNTQIAESFTFPEDRNEMITIITGLYTLQLSDFTELFTYNCKKCDEYRSVESDCKGCKEVKYIGNNAKKDVMELINKRIELTSEELNINFSELFEDLKNTVNDRIKNLTEKQIKTSMSNIEINTYPVTLLYLYSIRFNENIDRAHSDAKKSISHLIDIYISNPFKYSCSLTAVTAYPIRMKIWEYEDAYKRLQKWKAKRIRKYGGEKGKSS
jgi:hypothetical protein